MRNANFVKLGRTLPLNDLEAVAEQINDKRGLLRNQNPQAVDLRAVDAWHIELREKLFEARQIETICHTSQPTASHALRPFHSQAFHGRSID